MRIALKARRGRSQLLPYFRPSHNNSLQRRSVFSVLESFHQRLGFHEARVSQSRRETGIAEEERIAVPVRGFAARIVHSGVQLQGVLVETQSLRDLALSGFQFGLGDAGETFQPFLSGL